MPTQQVVTAVPVQVAGGEGGGHRQLVQRHRLRRLEAAGRGGAEDDQPTRLSGAVANGEPSRRRLAPTGMGWFKKLLGLDQVAAEVVSLTDDNFRREVLESPVPVLVDIWSDGCGPCKALEPVVMQLSRDYHGRLKVAELNAARAPKSLAKLGVRGTPTVIYFARGREVERVVGYRAGHYHRELIDQELLPPVPPGAAAS